VCEFGSAVAEGFIEGNAKDYEISQNDPFSSDFKYSRFDAVFAGTRNVSALTGDKFVHSTPMTAKGIAEAINDAVEMEEQHMPKSV